MRKLLTLIMLFFTITLFAQKTEITFKEVKRQPIFSDATKVIIGYTTSIILNAIGDGLYDKGITQGGNLKNWGKVCKVGSVGILLTSPFYINYEKDKWYIYLLSYASLRVSLFDPTYNLTRGLPVTYIGNTSLWDKGLRKLAPPEGFMLGRSVSLIMGISLPLNELDNPKSPKHYKHNKKFK